MQFKHITSAVDKASLQNNKSYAKYIFKIQTKSISQQSTDDT